LAYVLRFCPSDRKGFLLCRPQAKKNSPRRVTKFTNFKILEKYNPRTSVPFVYFVVR